MREELHRNPALPLVYDERLVSRVGSSLHDFGVISTMQWLGNGNKLFGVLPTQDIRYLQFQSL